jgi:hypothetical protein
MNGPRALATLIVLFAGCAGLAACSDPAPAPQAPSATPNAPAGPKLANPGEHMVAAVPAGKSARFVGVHFSLGSVPTVGRALPVEIAIIPHEGFTSLGASFVSQDGLTMMSGDLMPPTKDTKAEQILKHQLTLMPARDGVYMITTTVETEGADGTVSRVFSIPVIVGPPSAAGSAPAAPAASSPADSSASN